jgi:hypothetical protein
MAMRLRSFVLIVSLCLGSAVVGFWIGFRNGAQMGIMFDSIPRGSIAVFDLSHANQGKVTRNMVTNFEGDVDMALLNAYRLEHDPLYRLLEPVWSFPVSSAHEALVRVASYRREHPSPLSSTALAKEPVPDTAQARAYRRDLLEGTKETDRIVELMVKKYAQSR